MHAHRRTFLEFSSEITGYSPTELEGTGLVDQYHALVEQQAGARGTLLLRAAAAGVLSHRGEQERSDAMQIDVIASPLVWPLVQSLITLWYTGAWTCLPASWYALTGAPTPPGVTPGGPAIVPSAQAYEQQLAFRAAGAHPPGANPTGHGSWAIPPVFGDYT